MIPLRHSHATNRRRSQSRRSALPRRCTHHSSFARHLRRSTCKRSSKSCSRRRLTSNASFPRLRGSASLYCSTWTCECPVRKPYSPRARTIRYAPTQSLPILWRGAIPCVGFYGSSRVVIPVVLFGPPRTHCIYPTPFVTAPALLSSFRSIVATATYHAPSHPSVAFFILHVATCASIPTIHISDRIFSPPF